MQVVLLQHAGKKYVLFRYALDLSSVGMTPLMKQHSSR